ncbi:MAG: T9SS type A sorting domain-containing protein, partial [Saprospiraceae bacterium]|nr:T9SS type A sorting domain-containing protein [Saprospiraceae bacterium]
TQPNAIASNDGPITCTKTSVTLSAQPTTGVTYNWSNNATTQSVNVTIGGTYTVTITNSSNGCTATATTTVIENKTIPSVTASNNGPLTCTKTSVTLSATPTTEVTYLWSNSAVTQSINIATPGTYTVTITAANGCTGTATTIVTQDITQPNAIASNDGPITCTKTSVTLSAQPTTGVTYNWSNNATTQSVNVTIGGTYTVTITNSSNGCTATATTTVIENKTIPSVTASNNGPLTCTKTSVTLSATPTTGVTYLWSNSAITQTINIATPGTYTVTITAANGCTGTATTIVTQDITQPNAIASNDGPITCAKTSVTLSAQPTTGVTYNWSNNATTQSVNVTIGGTYTVTITNSTNGCTATATTTVIENKTIPSVTASNNGPLTCTKTSVTLSATPTTGVTYLWSNSAVTQSINIATPGTYTVTITAANGCTGTATTIVTQDITQPNAIASNDGPITCTKTSVTLSAQPTTGVTYNWSNNATTQSVNVTIGGTYTVTITNSSNGCTATATTTVIENKTIPSVTATNNGPLTCTKISVTLSATPTTGVTYLWSNSAVTQSINITTPGTYTVTITAANGCTGTATTIVTQDITQPNAIASNDGPITCAKTSVTLSAQPTTGVTYNWSNNATTQSVNVTAGGTYTVTITNSSNGCTATATTTVIENKTIPSVTATNNGPLTCTKTSVTLSATPTTGVTYLWSNNATTQSNNVTVPGTYTVTITAANGCTGTATTIVTQDITQPNAIASNDGPITCAKTSVTLSAQPTTGVTYNWSNNATTQSVNVTAGGTYTVTITNSSNGCTATATTTVIENKTIPSVTATNNGPLTCTKTSVTLSATPTTGVTYLWSNNATTQSNNVTVPGTYTVTITAANGCTGTATTIVTQDITQPNAIASNDGPITCAKTSVTLSAQPTTGVTYNWSNNATTQSVNVTAGGTYTVTITNSSNGCTATATTIVTQDITQPNPTASNDGPITCTKTTVTLTALPATDMTYRWSNNATTQTTIITTPGTYTVTVTGLNGCTAKATTVVTQDKTYPTVTISNDGPLTCKKLNVTLSATSSSLVKYRWSNDSTTQSINTGTSGVYTVTVTESNGCTASSTSYVAWDITRPDVIATNNGPINCINPSVRITASPTTNVTYQWSTNSIARSTTVITPGTYTVTVTNSSNGCTASAETIVTIDSLTPKVVIRSEGPLTCIKTNTIISTDFILDAKYRWSNDSTSNSISVNQSGTYTITVTSKNGCNSTSSITIIEDKSPPIAIASNNGPINCLKSSVTLSAEPKTDVTYKWSNGSTSQELNVTDVGTYTVTVTNINNGCTSTAITSVTKDNSVLNLILLNKGSINCINTSSTLTAQATPGVKFLWNTSAVTESIIVTSGGTFTVTVTDSSGCSETASTTVIENLTKPSAIASNDGPITCQKTSVTLIALPDTGVTYLWNTGETTQTLTTKKKGTYTVTVTNLENGCDSIVSTEVIDLNYTAIGDYVWEDMNGNGRQDSGEPGINDVLVTLLNDTGRVIETQLTRTGGPGGNSGFYKFLNVSPGNYSVKFTLPLGYKFTKQDYTPNDSRDSDPDPITGNTKVYIVIDCEEFTSIDAGIVKAVSIGDFVWDDTNGNGRQDFGEPGINNVVVKLRDTRGKVLASTLTRTKNNEQGYYEFTELDPGDYIINFTKPAQYSATLPNAVGSNDINDSDADPFTGSTTLIQLKSGDINTSIDAGFFNGCSIGNYVWLDDTNGVNNGVQDANEPGVNNIELALLDQNRNILSTTITANNPVTGEAGYYQFTNLIPGNYYVKFLVDTIQGYILTAHNSPNATSATNSDFDPLTRTTALINLVGGQSNQDIDAGVIYGPVPLEWLGFTATYNGTFVELDWQTGLEFNTDKFIIERKSPGQKNYSAIGEVKSKNNINVINDYHSDDFDVQTSGIYYYRIKQIDFDKSYTYSPERSVNIKKSEKFNLNIYPDPAKDYLNVKFNLDESSLVEMKIFNEEGKNVFTVPELKYYKAGSYLETIDISFLTYGQYYIEIKTNNNQVVQNFLKVK